MDIYQLKVFLSVYRNRSFSIASRELHLTQPSVSMHVKKLEEELSIQLFDRVGRKTIPTKEGTLLFNRAEDLMERLKDIKNDLLSSEKAVRGLITVGAAAVPGSYVIPPLAAEFSRQYPEVFFQVTIADSRKIIEQVTSGDLQLGIVDDPRSAGDIERIHTFKDELILVAKPGFVGKRSISPLKLFSIPLLMREEGSDSRASMEKQHLLHKISMKALNIKAILGSPDSLREAVKAGLGATILSRFVVKDDLKAGLVEEIKITGVRMKRNFHIICRKNRPIPGHYRVFVQFLSERLPSA
ncbi:MAG: selenium metabolism-associated LysR family transcriptional regulator [Nitrospirota bacterium]|nr:selenium metabolism-associated LysR family transcriptional regulator [Nitrospirota bacterium]